MGATGINHVSISAKDMEESARFYEEVLGMERIPSPDFGRPVCWGYPELTRLADQVPQSAKALRARLFLDPGEAVSAAPAAEAKR